jgi:hypothetical protein
MKLVLPTGAERELTEELISSIFKNKKARYGLPINIDYFASLFWVKSSKIDAVISLDDIHSRVESIRGANAAWMRESDECYPPEDEDDIENIYQLVTAVFPNYFDKSYFPNLVPLRSQKQKESKEKNMPLRPISTKEKPSEEGVLSPEEVLSPLPDISSILKLFPPEDKKQETEIIDHFVKLGIFENCKNMILVSPSWSLNKIDKTAVRFNKQVSLKDVRDFLSKIEKLVGLKCEIYEGILENQIKIPLTMDQLVKFLEEKIASLNQVKVLKNDEKSIMKALFPSHLNKSVRENSDKIMRIKKDEMIITLPECILEKIKDDSYLQDPIARLDVLYKKSRIIEEIITFENLHAIREKIKAEQNEILQVERQEEMTGRTFGRFKEVFNYDDDQFILRCIKVFYPEKFLDKIPDEKKLSAVLKINCTVRSRLFSVIEEDFQISLDFVKYDKFLHEKITSMGAIIIASDFDIFNKNKINLIVARYCFKDFNNAIEEEYRALMKENDQNKEFSMRVPWNNGMR